MTEDKKENGITISVSTSGRLARRIWFVALTALVLTLARCLPPEDARALIQLIGKQL